METPGIKVDAYCGRNVIDRPGQRPRTDSLNKGCHIASMLHEASSQDKKFRTSLV